MSRSYDRLTPGRRAREDSELGSNPGRAFTISSRPPACFRCRAALANSSDLETQLRDRCDVDPEAAETTGQEPLQALLQDIPSRSSRRPRGPIGPDPPGRSLAPPALSDQPRSSPAGRPARSSTAQPRPCGHMVGDHLVERMQGELDVVTGSTVDEQPPRRARLSPGTGCSPSAHPVFGNQLRMDHGPRTGQRAAP